MSDYDVPEDEATLARDDLDADPRVQLERWLEEARARELAEPNAMALATADAAGRPSVRMVLFKGLDDRGLRFFTNYESRKAAELDENPHAAVCFFWAPLRRQVRVEGAVEHLSAGVSDRYFASRPIESRLAAWASPQSQVVASRDVLEDRWDELASDLDDDVVDDGGVLPRPPFWGGYVLVPRAFEFWQGRAHRLHDRLRYRATGEGGEGAWTIERLAP